MAIRPGAPTLDVVDGVGIERADALRQLRPPQATLFALPAQQHPHRDGVRLNHRSCLTIPVLAVLSGASGSLEAVIAPIKVGATYRIVIQMVP